MKQLLLYGPLLWLRKVVIYLLLTAIISGLVVYFAANSPWVIKKAAERFAPDHNISYSRIHGNVLTGVEIDELAYKGDPLAGKVTLKWNPNGLLHKNIIVNTIQIEKANVDTIKRLVASFQDTERNESSESNGTASFAFGVEIDHLLVTIDPFVEQNMTISSIALKVNRLQYGNERLDADSIELKADSDLMNVTVNAKIEENTLAGAVQISPGKVLFERYALPVRKEAVGDIVIDFTASEKEVVADIDTQMKQLLKGEKDAFNLDIDRLQSHVVYDIKRMTTRADSRVILTTPYGKELLLTNRLMMDDTIRYSGEIHVPEITGVEAKFVKPLHDLKIDYSGDMQGIDANITARNLQGTFTSPDLKKALLHLESKEALPLNAFISLPAELNQSRADLKIDVPMDLDGNLSLAAMVNIDSDLLRMDANVSYEENLQIRSLVSIPKDSPLYAFNKEVKWDQLSPIAFQAAMKEDQVEGELAAGPLSAKAAYLLESKKIEGNIALGSLYTAISGVADEKINIDTKIDSLASLKENIDQIYSMEGVPPLKGRVDISVVISELEAVDIRLASPEIIYQADSKTEEAVNDIALTLHLEDSRVELQEYRLTYAKQKLFSTKPSLMTLEEDRVTIAPLWINDELQVTGEYDLIERKGTIDAEAEKLHIAHEIIDLDSRVNLKTELDGNRTSVNGKVTLLGGNIHYDLGQKTYASDSDIIIVQEMKEKEQSPFMEYLSTSIQVKTEKPLVYNKGDIDIRADVDVNIFKAEQSELMVLGSVEIHEGGTYRFEDKKFVFDKSYVHFTGNPNRPLIEASVNYRSLDHLITIAVTGTADSPNINFSSKPALTKEQILSIILFDSEGGAGTNSGEEMMKMMGGAMAKSALSNLGVQLDHLVIGEGNSVEVGRKLTEDIIIIYVKDEISRVKLKYRHGKRMESVIGVSEESQSYDIIYKKDF
ncbi:MAG TPA: translocation/assembly module TamB domain-containing protein [Sulfurovum sp.]|uniref:translocation/assembly module TamB domain-containing protein n=1 Tax=Sulfurovum sp. TaxID=1969726 RepID=UPI002F9579C6